MSEAQMQHAQQLHRAGDLSEAEKIYRQILANNPADATATFLLGQLLQQTGRLAEAIERLSAVVNLQPEFPEGFHQLGIAQHAAGDKAAAFACYRRALELRPRYALALNSLGIAYQSSGDYGKAMESFRAALEIQGDLDSAMSNLGLLLSAGGRNDEALELLARVARLRPELASAHNNLGVALRVAGRQDEAAAAFAKAISLRTDYAEAFNNLGNVLMDSGQSELALGYYGRAVQLQPARAQWHSNLVAAMGYVPLESPRILRDELQRWNAMHAEPLAREIRAHYNSRHENRRIKIGYVSPDFLGHPIGRFMLPLLQNHNHTAYEIFCYSDVHWHDETTRRLQSLADAWRDARGRSDAELADLIRGDEIDILVDLSLHTAGNRLLTCARKPSPVQVTFLAYCGSSGMTAMDYRLTDPYLDPPGCDESAYSEKSVCLARTYWCYQPMMEDISASSSLPALRDGVVTFASFNNLSKLSADAWKLWMRVLAEVPQSRLVLSCPFGSRRNQYRADLEAGHLNPDRLSFAPPGKPREYFENYNQVDIGLDSFPFNGGTTTCDSLWMGVPSVTLRGSTAVGRAGVSILTNAGLPELIADSPDEYVAIAKQLAGDLPRLAEIRRGLRDKMQASPLMDAGRYARDVEEAFRAMWRDWCGRKTA